MSDLRKGDCDRCKLAYRVVDGPCTSPVRLQFHQFGIEFIGATHSFSDVEVIDLANTLLNRLGIQSSCSVRRCIYRFSFH